MLRDLDSSQSTIKIGRGGGEGEEDGLNKRQHSLTFLNILSFLLKFLRFSLGNSSGIEFLTFDIQRIV